MATAVDPDLALFAAWYRGEEDKARQAKKAARDERKAADEANKLEAAKRDAAAEVKRLRNDPKATPEQRAAADEAYKAALAAVVAAETGEAPAWAPPVPEPEELVEAEATSEGPGGDLSDDSESDAPDAPAEGDATDDELAAEAEVVDEPQAEIEPQVEVEPSAEG